MAGEGPLTVRNPARAKRAGRHRCRSRRGRAVFGLFLEVLRIDGVVGLGPGLFLMNRLVRLLTSSAFGPLVLKRTVRSSTLVTLSTEDEQRLHVGGGLHRALHREDTSSAVSDPPLWNFTLGAQLESQTVGSSGDAPGGGERADQLAIEAADHSAARRDWGEHMVRARYCPNADRESSHPCERASATSWPRRDRGQRVEAGEGRQAPRYVGHLVNSLAGGRNGIRLLLAVRIRVCVVIHRRDVSLNCPLGVKIDRLAQVSRGFFARASCVMSCARVHSKCIAR